MAQAREVRDCFEELISGNNKVISKLEQSKKEARRDREDIETQYMADLSRFAISLLQPVDSDALEKLSEAANLPAGFEQQYRQKTTASKTAEMELTRMVYTHGEMDTLQEKSAAAAARAEATDAEKSKCARLVESHNALLADADAFNLEARKNDKLQLRREDISYFESKGAFAHAVAWVFVGHYRRGRAILKSFSEKGTTLFAAQDLRDKDTAALKEITAQSTEQNAEKQNLLSIIRLMEDTQSKIVSDDQIVSDVAADMIKKLHGIDCFKQTAEALKDKMPKELIEARAKIETFSRIEKGLDLQIQSLNKASGNLSKHMSKLNKAVRHNSRKNIAVDLNQIKKAYKAGQERATHNAAEMKKASSSVRQYTPSSTPDVAATAGLNVLDLYVHMMIFNMLFHPSHVAVDPHAVQSVIGIPDSVAQMDVPGLGSDTLGQGTEGISADFGAAAGSIDTGSIDVSVPDISVPDISVPDISIPDISIDVGGGDFGGGGGFDIGGF